MVQCKSVRSKQIKATIILHRYLMHASGQSASKHTYFIMSSSNHRWITISLCSLRNNVYFVSNVSSYCCKMNDQQMPPSVSLHTLLQPTLVAAARPACRRRCTCSTQFWVWGLSLICCCLMAFVTYTLGPLKLTHSHYKITIIVHIFFNMAHTLHI